MSDTVATPIVNNPQETFPSILTNAILSEVTSYLRDVEVRSFAMAVRSRAGTDLSRALYLHHDFKIPRCPRCEKPLSNHSFNDQFCSEKCIKQSLMYRRTLLRVGLGIFDKIFDIDKAVRLVKEFVNDELDPDNTAGTCLKRDSRKSYR